MHADRTNRVVLTVVGAIALLLGVGGLLAAAGVFGSSFQHRRLLDNRVSRYFSDHGEWLWPAIAAAVFVLLLLTLLWLLRLLFSNDRTGDIAITSANEPATVGRTRLRTSALTQAVTHELSTYRGVTDARARVIGEAQAATLILEVSASRRTKLPEVLHRIESEAVQHVRDALEEPDFPVQVNLTVNDKTVARAS